MHSGRSDPESGEVVTRAEGTRHRQADCHKLCNGSNSLTALKRSALGYTTPDAQVGQHSSTFHDSGSLKRVCAPQHFILTTHSQRHNSQVSLTSHASERSPDRGKRDLVLTRGLGSPSR